MRNGLRLFGNIRFSGGLSVRPWEEPGQAPELIDQLEALLRPAADTARQELAALAAQWAPEGETT